jgi:hypothetical protein
MARAKGFFWGDQFASTVIADARIWATCIPKWQYKSWKSGVKPGGGKVVRYPGIQCDDRLAALLWWTLLGVGWRRRGLIHQSVVAVTQDDRFMLLASRLAFLINLGFDLRVAIIRDLR